MQGFRTLAFGALVTILGGLQASHVATIVPAEWTGVVMAGIGTLVMVLRALTSTPVATPEPKA